MIRLANMPMPHVAGVTQSVLGLFRNKGLANSMHRPIPAPEPDPEPNPAPDVGLAMRHVNISPDDWDELFYAVQTRLENCVDEAFNKSPELPFDDRHAVIKAHVLDCVASMRQLHASLTLERLAHQKI